MDCCAVAESERSWPLAVMSFAGMWILMMAPMMLPVLVPSLARYRRAIGATGGWGSISLTAVASAGYFLVWAALGVLLGPLAAGLAALEGRVPVLAGVVPIASGAVVLIAGFMQISAWKARGIECCREEPGAISGDPSTAWRHGVRMGVDCVRCCGNLMAVLLALGMMDARWMMAVTAAITVERVAPSGLPVARAIGVAVIICGVFLIARASGLS
jgi:predicted metal-binding membrane protein